MCTMTALKCGAWHCITVFRPNLWRLSINFNVNPGKNRKFAKALAFWSRSSMDRIQDSGSYDMGSIPVGTTSSQVRGSLRTCVFYGMPRTGSVPTSGMQATTNKNNNKIPLSNKKAHF